ncbi:MAG: hypothetical protein ACKO37_09425 [Vampirovibrionales bacterium]
MMIHHGKGLAWSQHHVKAYKAFYRSYGQRMLSCSYYMAVMLACCLMCQMVWCGGQSGFTAEAASIQVGPSPKSSSSDASGATPAGDDGDIEVNGGLVSAPGETSQTPTSQVPTITKLEQVKFTKEEQLQVALKCWQLMFRGDIDALYGLGELYEKKGHLAMAYAYYLKGAKLAQDGLSEDASSRLESQLTPEQRQQAMQEVVKFAQLVQAQEATRMTYVTYRQEISKPSTSQARIRALSQSIEDANRKQQQAFAAYRPYDGAFLGQAIKTVALTGHAEANFVLADFHRLGILVPQSDTEMAKYAKKAAFGGHPSGMLLHAIALSKGLGAEPSQVDILAWIYLAADRGCGEAKMQLPALQTMVPNDILTAGKARMAQLQRTVPKYHAVLDR